MNKTEIENVLIKSFSYFKSILGDHIDIGELKELRDWIMYEMDEEVEIENQIQRNYVVSESSLSMLKNLGKYEFKDIMGNRITLCYENNNETPSVLESGTRILWDNDGCKNTKKMENHQSKKTKRLYQSLLGCKTLRKVSFEPRNKRFDFNKNLHDIDDLIRLCNDFNWKNKAKDLREIREKIMIEKMNHYVMNGRQKTLKDYIIHPE